MVFIHIRLLNPRGVFINSGEHSFSAQSLIKRQEARWNGPPSHPSLIKIRVGAATRSTSLKALDQFSHILITMSMKGECWEIEYYNKGYMKYLDNSKQSLAHYGSRPSVTQLESVFDTILNAVENNQPQSAEISIITKK